MYEWTYELPKKLRLRPLENREILVKCQNPMGTEPSVQSLVPKESFGAGAKNVQKPVLKFFGIL